MEIKRINKQQIIEKIKEKGYVGKLILYEEMKELYATYGRGMKESDFAQTILGITYSSYNHCKNEGTRVKLFKGEKLKDEEIQIIIEKLKEKEYKGRLILYEELQQLHREYGKGISEIDFAQSVLGVSYGNYKFCKNRGTRVRILKDKKNIVSKEEIQNRIDIIKEKGYIGKLISYQELQKLYAEYGSGMSEIDFVQIILGVSTASYETCKYKDIKVRVLKGREKVLLEEEKKEIIGKIKGKGYIGKLISYHELQKLYAEYGRGISEIDFVQIILGISYGNYIMCKNKGTHIKIKDGIVYDKAKEIQELYFSEPGYYSKEFIDNICTEYDITVEEFIAYVVFKGFFDVTKLKKVLEEKDRIWIGKIQLTKEFIDENIEEIQIIAIKIINSLCFTYKKMLREDYIQDVIIYIIENMGEEEKNFGDNIELFKNRIYKKARKYCEGRVIDNLNINSKVQGFTRFKRCGENDDGEFEIEVIDENVNVEKEAIERQERRELIEDRSGKCIKLLSDYIEFGYDKCEAIAMTAEKMNIDSNTMLEYMKHYLLTKGKVRIRKNGEVEVGEDR